MNASYQTPALGFRNKRGGIQSGARGFAVDASAELARIGPNALIQTVEALVEVAGIDATRRVLTAGGRGELLTQRPVAMVDENEFVALIATLRRELSPDVAESILGRGGERTGDYLLAHRIPRPARAFLPHLPRRLALRVLLKAIGAHAWTFAGSGRFSWEMTETGALIRLADGPEARGHAAQAPCCAYYRNCFQTLLRSLVDRGIVVRETSCAAVGSETCEFAVAWPGRDS